MTAHSIYGPSGFKRIMLCPGSVQMCRTRQGLDHGTYADNGDKAHTLAAHVVKHSLVLNQFKNLTLGIDTGNGNIVEVTGTNDILNTVRPYMKQCKGLINSNPNAWWDVEFCWDLSWVHPEMYGTADFCMIVTGKRGYVWDLKAGAGEWVDEINNPQLILYALGMVGPDNLYQLKDVELGIVQPNHYKNGPKVRSTIMTVKQLYQYKEDVIDPAIKAAEDLNATCVPGKVQCQFCDAMPCPAVDNVINFIIPEEKQRVAILPEEMSGESLAKAMQLIPVINKWVKAIPKEVRRRHDTGHVDPAPGYELAKGKTIRKWNKEENKIADELSIYLPSDMIYTTQSVKTVKQMGDTLESFGMSKSIIANLIEKTNRLTMKPVSPNNKKPLLEASEMFKKRRMKP